MKIHIFVNLVFHQRILQRRYILFASAEGETEHSLVIALYAQPA